MSLARPPLPGLRVAIAAADPVRRLGLAAIVGGAGHIVVDDAAAADVVLADDAAAPVGGPPVLALGAEDRGQAGLLPNDAAPAQIQAALLAVAAGLRVRPVGSARPAFGALADADAPLPTPREIEVLAAIGDGLSNKEAARRLGISQHTVKFHVESLFRKLGAVSRADAVRKGLRQRLIEM